MATKTWMALAAAAALLGGGAWLAQRTAASKGMEPPPPTLIFSPQEVAQAEPREMARVVEFSGPLVAPATALVRAKAAGTLLSLAVAEGSRVSPGQVLGELDLAELKARLNERTALAESARAQWAQADRTHASNQHLAEQQFISPNALETSLAARESARAQLAAAKAQVETVRIALREAALVAPIRGIVAKRQVLPGEKVAAEQALLTLVDLRHLEMAGSVGAHEVGQLQPGLPVQVTVEGDTQAVAARLSRIAPAVDTGSRSIGVTVELDNPQERWRAGQYAQAQVRLPSAGPVLSVPRQALATASGQTYVWSLESGKLMRRTVVTGASDPQSDWVEILQGLPSGAVVLARRFANLKEGASAQVGPSEAARAASAALVAASAAR